MAREMKSLDHALRLAAKGLRIFPCRNTPGNPERHKAPLTIRGFKDATADEAVIRAWWERWPNALVGVVAERFGAVDVDRQHESERAWHDQHRHEVPITRIYQTQRGGFHFLFKPHPDVGCTVGTTALGVDTRGQGKGYLIWWPAAGFEVLHRRVIAPMPQWIVNALRPATTPQPAATSPKRPSNAFVTAKLAGIISRAASAQEGKRNSVTFWCGCRLAEMVRDRMIGREEAVALLIEAYS